MEGRSETDCRLRCQILVPSQQQSSSQGCNPAKQILHQLSMKWMFMCASEKQGGRRRRCLHMHPCFTSTQTGQILSAGAGLGEESQTPQKGKRSHVGRGDAKAGRVCEQRGKLL